MPASDVLQNRLMIFAGKGGVGKTTWAAATAMALHPKRTLIISLDPAHSLGDCLGQEVGHLAPNRVQGTDHLFALEVDPVQALDEFRNRWRQALRRLLETSSGFQYLTPRDREGLLSLPIPGADEVIALKRVQDLMDAGFGDAYVIDTAPTGHALRLLTTPDLLVRWVTTFRGLRAGRKAQAAGLPADAADVFLQDVEESARRIRDLLTRPDVEFVVVTSAEDLAVEETKDLVGALQRFGVSVRRVLVNKLFPDLPGDFARIRREGERRAIDGLVQALPELEVHELPLHAQEPRGLGRLANLGRYLYAST